MANLNIPANEKTGSGAGDSVHTMTSANPQKRAGQMAGNYARITPQATEVPWQQNVTDFGGDIIGDPSAFFNRDDPKTGANESMFLSQRVPQINGGAPGTNIDGAAEKYNTDFSRFNVDSVAAGPAQQAQTVGPKNAQGYTPEQVTADVLRYGQMTGAHGQVSEGAQIDPAQIGTEALARGDTELGRALGKAATQDISRVIDTSTVAGKMLADKLGEGNYTDAKATVKGQLDILQAEFQDPVTGEPKIPAWAAGTAREVSRIAAFKGVSGTAATAAMAQALMEASLPVAQADAQFFQTVTLQNLNNRQASTINKANVLAKMEMANLDARMTAAVENSKAFLQMDLTNLSNKQQAQVINTQARVQALMEDANQVNLARRFQAESQNDFDKFYSQLNAQIQQFNAEQVNSMRQFDVTQRNDVSKFNATLENTRQQFYQSMQYQIDQANAKWRQTIATTEFEADFEAQATDVKNLVGVSVEQLAQIWDRSDSLLDYLWQSSESALDRAQRLAEIKLTGSVQSDIDDNKGIGNFIGTITEGVTGGVVEKASDWLVDLLPF